MSFPRRSVVDIGTNSVKLLVAEVGPGTVMPLDERSEQTRLGQDFYETHRLQPAAILRTVEAVAVFSRVALAYGADAPRVIATSAARDAVNAVDLVSAVEAETGLSVEIISGDQEAAWAYAGVRSDPALSGRRLLLMDLGGGSTEFILGEDARVCFAESFPLGSVRLLESLRLPDPPLPALADCARSIAAFLQEKIRPTLAPRLAEGGPTLLVGTGGTFTILARLERRQKEFTRHELEGVELTSAQVDGWVRELWERSLIQRQQLPGLPRKRADVILTGSAICSAIMREFGLGMVRVSTRGLRFGALLDGV